MLNYILLQQAAAADMQGAGWSSWIMIIAIIAIFYFFMIRPQQKQRKETQKFHDSLTKGTKVITAGGIHGRVVEVDGPVVLLEIASGIKIRINKTSIYPSHEAAGADAANPVNAEKK
ncbi:MAG: preprotein translocase subunit YajC [Muribaculaceae bacterium]|nr:preprotein translocase subunit YajC [Muribaculaceae bacterium]MDE6462115.1 preprotein translocase subunit YajC [Muribaculaceae bacterium]MDE6508918.1 preprotein translocase subunit YajC [Muribaculaceae bacterium]MDE7143622.1 preprotein translocase subunit YajC [Muribaculaceae bacterium]